MADMDDNALLPVGAQEVLDKIASGESTGYNELYGGGTFDGFADHPRQRFELGNGLSTDAAGKYQFLSRTWDSEANKLGLSSFDPHSQDLAAWDLANSTYKQKTGRDLATDSESGKVDWSVLAGQWPSLAKVKQPGQEPATSPSQEPALLPNQDQPAPNLVDLLKSLSPQVKFTPVDYDPFAVMPQIGDSLS